jgi:LPS export ABC transporter protein LptC
MGIRAIKIIFIIALITGLGIYYKNTFLGQPETELSTGSGPGVQPIPSGEKISTFSISGFSDSGEKAWVIEGKSADILSDAIELFDINADSYGDSVKVNLTADRGTFNRKSNDIKLISNVKIVTDEGTVLTTEFLNWDASEEIVHTDSDVFIEREEMDITGTGAIARPNLNTAQLNHNVRVYTRDPSAIITCDGPLEIDYENNTAYFTDNVKVVDKETSIITDRAIAHFRPKERSLEKVFCEGNVSITKGRDTTHAEQLTYLPEEGRVVLEGRPKIIIRDTESFFERSKQKRSNNGE